MVTPSKGLISLELCFHVMFKGKSPLDTAQDIVVKSSALIGLSVNSNGVISGDTGNNLILFQQFLKVYYRIIGGTKPNVKLLKDLLKSPLTFKIVI